MARRADVLPACLVPLISRCRHLPELTALAPHAGRER